MGGRISAEKEQAGPWESPCGKRSRESKMKSEVECESASNQKVRRTKNKRKTNGAARNEEKEMANQENFGLEELESRV
jgi:hypothetical protein